MEISRRTAISALAFLPLLRPELEQDIRQTHALVSAARTQIGITTLYDPAYVRLAYPGGDVPTERGVCIDVIIRAYRDAFDFDFQKEIHQDMAAHFGAYPDIWGLTRTDRNIDHRRVPNLETWLSRRGYEQPAENWQPGDMMTCRVGGSLPHIGILSGQRGRNNNLLAIHNIGLGTLEDSRIWAYGQKRRFRFLPERKLVG